MDTQFLNEHLRPGQLGHFFAILSFVGALFSAFSYWRAAQTETIDPNNSNSWLIFGRNAFVIHAASVVAIFISLYYIITRHLFEYNYAWEHSNLALPSKYLLSCFWEGQEGSFLLWTFWHSILGLVVMKTAKKLETRTMTIIALVQACLATMLLGFYLGADVQIGSTPFMLLRNKMAGAPIFSQPNYMSFIQDGNGLNPLLQNYWMVIHPPILFLGFASTLIPFAYTIAALWKGDFNEWAKPALNWSLFSGGILGLGIMMGGAWAYESLSFGGYWAWDPVENASLVPWLTMVAGLHTLLVYRSTGRSLVATFIFFILSYLLIWYSTFLTRTGVLGDTSVHAFTGEGKSLYWHLLIVIGVLLTISTAFMAWRWKKMPRVRNEEELSSREFWMFIGSFVLFLSALHIILKTSLPIWAPVVKWITGDEPAPSEHIVQEYNNLQVWVAIIIAILSASILYLKFKKSDAATFWKKVGLVALISLVISLFISYTMKIDSWQYAVLMFAACFTVVANLVYAITMQSGAFKKRGAAITHLGFGVLLIGIVLSSYRKEVISYNTLGMMMNFGKKTDAENAKESQENTVLYRGVPVPMGDYAVTYMGDSTVAPTTYYKVQYEKIDSVTKEVTESFTLYPDVFVNKKGGQNQVSNNPSSKHYLTKDIFTYVTPFAEAVEDTNSYKEYKVKAGDTTFVENGYFVFDGFNKDVNDPRYVPMEGDMGAVSAKIRVYNSRGHVQDLAPVFILRKNGLDYVEDTVKMMKLYTRFASIIPEEDAAVIMTKQISVKDDFVVMKAILFPYINLVWLGVIITVFGFFLSMWNRASQKVMPKVAEG